MSNFNSWEDEQNADEELSNRAQSSLNFNPASANFRPGAPSFAPQQFNQYQQYQQYPPQHQPGQWQQYQGYSGGPQYQYQQQQQPQQQQQQRQQHQYGYGQYQQAQQQQAYTGQAPIANQTVAPPSAVPAQPNANSDPQPSTKVEKTGATKVLSIGLPATSKPTPSETSNKRPEDVTPKPTVTKTEKVEKAEKAEKVEKAEKAEKAEKVEKTAPTSKSEGSTTVAKKVAVDVNAVADEQLADVDEETLKQMYGKEHINVVFLGHVDAGKSTLGGSILVASGMVDQRTLDKYKRDAKEAGREMWYLSWALDLDKEERAKGKTVQLGRGFFETEHKRYSILDAPGHKNFVPEAISGAAQADVGILVISARKGEYETGFEKGGQTREHAMLAKTQGVNKLIVVVNKCDDGTVNWSQERFTECITKLTMFLKGVGYNPKTDLAFIPISAQTGLGVKNRVPTDICPWYNGPSLLEYLDSMSSMDRKLKAPLMMPISAKYRDLGTMVEGKIEAGILKKTDSYLIMPNRNQVGVLALFGESEEEIDAAKAGEQVRIRLKGVEEEEISTGFVLCQPSAPVHCVNAFEAQIVILEVRSIISAGYNCVLHVHSATEEVTFAALLHKLEKGTNRRSKRPPGFATKGMSIIARIETIGGGTGICVERFEDYAQMGRFTLRDQGQTIAIGKVTKLITDSSTAAA